MKQVFVIILILMSVSYSNAQIMGKQTVGMLEESPAGSKVLRVMKAINKKVEVDDNFVTTNFSKTLIDKNDESTLKYMLTNEIHEKDGYLTVYKINRPETFKYVMTVKGSKSGWLLMIYHMENQSPYRILGLEIDAIDDPGEVGTPLDL